MKILLTVESCPVLFAEELNLICFTAKFAIDCDGSRNPDQDPDWQWDTTLHGPDGKPIDSERVRGIVLPPGVINAVTGTVLGSLVKVTNTKNGKTADAVVFDVGPHFKLGEGTPALARALGLDPNSRHGGTDERIIGYEVHVGVPAVLDGITYALKPFHHHCPLDSRNS
jgi:hypothetical protein